MRKKLGIFISAGIVVLILIVCCSDNAIIEPPPGFVSGHVYEAGTTTPIDSVNMYFESTDDTTFTDQNGYYILHAWPGNYKLDAEKNGYLNASAEIDLIPDDTITQDFELQKE